MEERTKQEMINKIKASAIEEDKRNVPQECDGYTRKNVIKVRLHMWQVNCNYKRDDTDIKCR